MVEINLSIRDIEEILALRYGGKPRFTWAEPGPAIEGWVFPDDLTRESILVTLTYEQ